MSWAAEVLLREGAERLAVSLTAEGLELRKAGVTKPILLLGGSFPDEAPDIVTGQLTPMVTAPALARALNEAARSSRRTLPMHLKLETGLGRLGIPLPEFPAFLQFIQGLPSLTLEGIGSTFSSVEDRGKAQMQMETLERAAHEAAAQLKRPLLCHIAHTGGLLRGLTRDGWLVRPGIMLYGYTRGLAAPGIDLRPVLSWKTEIFSIRSFPEGHPIGYSGTYRTSQGSRIALLPVGYSDGLLRSYMESGRY